MADDGNQIHDCIFVAAGDSEADAAVDIRSVTDTEAESVPDSDDCMLIPPDSLL